MEYPNSWGRILRLIWLEFYEMKIRVERSALMEAIHGSQCNVRYSRPKRCKFCNKSIIWYSCDHLSVRGLPLDSRDPWIEHKCPRFNLHRWKKDVGFTPIGKFISSEMSSDQNKLFEAVMKLNKQLLLLRKEDRNDFHKTVAAINERVRLSEILLQLPESLRGKDIKLPEEIKNRRAVLLKQRTDLLRWRDEMLQTR